MMYNINFKKVFLSLLALIVFAITSCKKDSSPSSPNNPAQNPSPVNNAPSQFTTLLVVSSWDTAKISWTMAIDPDNDSIAYKIFINDTLKVDNYKGLTYTFRNLTELTSYSVKVVAFDTKLKESTSSLNFTTSKYWLKFFRKVEYGDITGYSSQKTGQMVKANDGGYIIAGNSQLGDWPYGITNMFTMKIDSLGNKIWMQRYNYNAGNSEKVRIVNCNNGYLICGDYDLIKVDNNGNLVWHKDYLLSGIMTGIGVGDDGSIYATGKASDANGAGTVEATLDKYDQYGNVIWRKTFQRGNWTEFHDVKIYSDNEIIVGGVTGEPKANFWVMKVNNDGNILWEKTYPTERVAFLKNIIKTREGNYVFTGCTLGAYVITYFYLQMIDAAGNNMWAYNVNDNNTVAYSVAETNDNSLIVTGSYQQSYSAQSALYKFDKNGNKLWEKLYSEFATYLSNKTVIQTNDGGYIINSQKAKAYNNSGETDQIYIFKTNDKGEFN